MSNESADEKQFFSLGFSTQESGNLITFPLVKNELKKHVRGCNEILETKYNVFAKCQKNILFNILC